MRVRTDFVTNSSSSSFILAFKDQNDYARFKAYCEEYDYKQFYRLINRLLQSSAHNKKESALELLYNYYMVNVVDKFGLIRDYAKSRGRNEWDVWKEAEENPDIKAEIEHRLSESDYEEKRQRILNSEIVVNSEIWDSYGGVLEWAIRRDFIKYNFLENHICTLHVG